MLKGTIEIETGHPLFILVDLDDDGELWLQYTGEPPSTKKEAAVITLDNWKIRYELIQKGVHVHVRAWARGTCGFCMRYGSNCRLKGGELCPVAEVTGQRYCNATPYNDYLDARDTPKIGEAIERVYTCALSICTPIIEEE